MTEWATSRRRRERCGSGASRTAPPARPPASLLARLMTIGREHLSKADAVTVATVETSCARPRVLASAATRDLLERFHHMLRAHDTDALTPWLADTEGSLIASFGDGIKTDFAAVSAALEQSLVERSN